MNRPEPSRAHDDLQHDLQQTQPRVMCSSRQRELLVPYALTGCRPEEALEFEAHILGCDACFDDLQLLDRAAAVIGDWSIARLTLADLFYNSPRGQGPSDRLQAMLDSIIETDGTNRAQEA